MVSIPFRFILIGIFFFVPQQLVSKIVGSSAAVSIEPFTTFPASDLDNAITGFAWMKNGFEFEDSTTTLVCDALNPILGEVRLNGGTLQHAIAGKNLPKYHELFASVVAVFWDCSFQSFCEQRKCPKK